MLNFAHSIQYMAGKPTPQSSFTVMSNVLNFNEMMKDVKEYHQRYPRSLSKKDYRHLQTVACGEIVATDKDALDIKNYHEAMVRIRPVLNSKFVGTVGERITISVKAYYRVKEKKFQSGLSILVDQEWNLFSVWIGSNTKFVKNISNDALTEISAIVDDHLTYADNHDASTDETLLFPKNTLLSSVRIL